ncbi:MAG: hypothetical protein V2J89_01065 [Halieaceae bacterium]|jgi:hypothetical protein|nr:hypothetical protein [Halieaceae bacterium]
MKLHVFLFTVSVAIALPALAEDDFPGIQVLMGERTFRDAGLEKLSPDELEALDAWLVRYTAGEAEVVRESSEEVKKVEKALEITASIKPPFSGWSGDTVFYLDNGQVWKQRVDGRYQFSGEDTRVIIRKGLFGFYNLELVAAGKRIGVERVR